MTDPTPCPAVERNARTISSAWALAGTRISLYALYEDLAAGATIVEWFPDVSERQVYAVDDVSGRQKVATGDHGFTGGTASNGAACGQQLRLGGSILAPSTPPPPSGVSFALCTMASPATW